MSERDVIAEVLRSEGWTCEHHEPVSERGECIQCDDSHDRIGDRAVAALRESRTVRTADEVPVGAVVRSTSGTIACRFDGTQGVVLGDDRPFPWHSLSCPLTILYRPDEDGAL